MNIFGIKNFPFGEWNKDKGRSDKSGKPSFACVNFDVSRLVWVCSVNLLGAWWRICEGRGVRGHLGWTPGGESGEHFHISGANGIPCKAQEETTDTNICGSHGVPRMKLWVNVYTLYMYSLCVYSIVFILHTPRIWRGIEFMCCCPAGNFWMKMWIYSGVSIKNPSSANV